MIRKLCGTQQKSPIVSASNEMTVEYHRVCGSNQQLKMFWKIAGMLILDFNYRTII